MATYKILYTLDNSYVEKHEVYVDNVYDEYDAVEVGMYKFSIPNSAKILKVDFICE